MTATGAQRFVFQGCAGMGVVLKEKSLLQKG